MFKHTKQSKHKNIKFNQNINKLSAFFLAALLLVTSLPTNVYAFKGEINSGTSTSFGSPSSAEDAKFGDFATEGVRVYLHDKSTGTFIESEADEYKGIKCFDFLGYDGVYDFAKNNVNSEDISTETAFGSLELSDIYISTEWPFTKDNTNFYFANYEFDGVDMAGVSWHNSVISGTPWVDDALKANDAALLKNIIANYWGEGILSKFSRSENMLFIVEPLFIISEATDQISEDPSELGSNYFKCGEQPYVIKKYIIEPMATEDICYGKSNENKDGEITITLNHISYKANYHCCADDGTNSAEEICEYLVDKGVCSYSDLSIIDTEVHRHESGESGVDDLNHMDIIYWDEETTKPLYRGFKYVYGTAREIYRQGKEDGAAFASNYTIMDSCCNAVYTAQVGENGEYNADFDLVFPSNYNGDKYTGTVPEYEGSKNVLTGSNGDNTTWGIYMLSSLEMGDCVWHTNDYQQSKESAAPSASGEDEPNESLTYGNNICVKIYETRDKDTNKLLETSSFIRGQIPDTVEIEDELYDTWKSEITAVPGTPEVERTWIKWMKSVNKGEFNEAGEVQAFGSGYRLEDWCTCNRSYETAINLMMTDNEDNGGYYYQTKDIPKLNAGKGACWVTLAGSKENGEHNIDENTLYVRLVKYIDGDDGDTPDTPDTEPLEADNNSVITESQLSVITDSNALINNFKAPMAISFISPELGGSSISDGSLSLAVGMDEDDINRMKYSDLSLGSYSYQTSRTRESTSKYRTSIGNQGYHFVVRRPSDDIKGIVQEDISLFNGQGNNYTITQSNINEQIRAIYGTDNEQVVSNETEDTSEPTLTSTTSTDITDGMSCTDNSSDNITSSDTGEQSYASLASDIEDGTFKMSVETLKPNENTSSKIMQNSSNVALSNQVAATKTVRPIVLMQYQTATNLDDLSSKQCLVTQDVTRTFACNAYSGAAYSYSNENLIMNSNMWALDARLTSGDGWRQKNSVLKGGSAYTLSTDNNTKQSIKISSIQMIKDSSTYDNSAYVGYSDSGISNEQALAYHNDLANQAYDKLKQAYITQYISTDVDSSSKPWNDIDGQAVSGDTSGEAYSSYNKSFQGIELSSDAKYWFTSNNSSVNGSNEGDFDTKMADVETIYYKFICNVYGEVWLLTSKDESFPESSTTKELILARGQGIDSLTSPKAKELNDKTNVLTNMLNVIVRNAGNDINAGWTADRHYDASGNIDASQSYYNTNGKWYNEYASVTLMFNTSKIEMGLMYPNKRTAVVDPRLCPPIISKTDQGTTAYKSAFKTSLDSNLKLGTFRTESTEIGLANADTIYNSRTWYITNMTVQDNN